MVFIIFLFFLFFSRPVFASPVVTITVVPSSANSGSTIPIQFTIENSDPNISYHYKIFGGIGSSNTQIQTNESLNYNSEWDSFSTFNVDSDGRKAIDTTAYIKPNSLSGDYNLFVRIAKADTHSSTYTSNSVNLSIIGPTSTPTSTPTTTPTPINTPTPDLTIINPESGIILSEFMPYASLEWIEIYNNNDKSVELKNWKIKDSSSNTKTIPDTKISPKSYFIFEFSSFLNNDTDKIILINHNNQTVNQYEYPDDKMTLERSWSFISNSWCQANITQNKINETSCYTPPTPTQKTATPTISPTNTITPTAVPTDKNLYKADALATESAIIDPIEESSFYTTPTITTAPLSSKLVLGETTTVKKNYLPLIFIISGGLLLATPIILDKIKKK